MDTPKRHRIGGRRKIPHGHLGINDLPDELLANIFGYFRPIDDRLPLLAQVCKKWLSVLCNHGSLWRRIYVDPTGYNYWHFSLLCTIFRLYGQHIQKLLWRENSPVYESVFSLVPRLCSLRSLRLPILWTRAIVESLSSLRGLEQIQVNGGFSLTDGELELIGHYFPHLKEISLNACWKVTAGGVLELFQKLRNLQCIKLKINSGLPLSDVRADQAMAEGAEIVRAVSESQFSKYVTVLCLHFVPVEMDELWDIVNNLTRIKKLSISNCEVCI